jgi:hypothetical protein
MSPIPTATLEIRTPRTAEQTPEAMAQFFTALPSPPRGLMGFWRQAPSITLEFLNQGQMTYCLVSVPANLSEYLQSQLAAAYPEVLVKPLAHNPLDEFAEPKPKDAGELKFTGATYLPLRSFREYPESDPLSSVLSSLSKLGEGEAALIQLTIRKTRERWKSAAYSMVHQGVKQTDGSSVPHPHKEALSRKLNQGSFAFRLRMLAQAPDQARARQIIDSLSTAYGAFHSETNSFVLRRPLLRAERFREQVLKRQLGRAKSHLSLDEAASLFHLPNQRLATIKNIAWGKNLLGEPPENLPTFTHTSEEERKHLNLFSKVEFKNQEHIFGLKRGDRARHTYLVGKSGTGKSTLLANMIINDLKHGEGLAVVDPHGDLIETILDYIPKHRINDVIVFDPADPQAVVKLNLFEGGSEVYRELVASGIVAIFQKMYANSWGPRLEYILRNTLLTLLDRHAKLEDVLRILTDERYREKVVSEMDDQVLKNFWVAEFNQMQPKLRTESISPILNKVGQFVTSPLIRNVVNTTTSSFDIEEIMNQGKILLVNVSQGKLGEDNAALLGAMIITKIQLAAMNRVYLPEEQRRDFYLYIDEFQNFATTSFVKILSEARKYRLNLILANQYIAQIPEEVRAAIFGNAGNLISFIVGADDAIHLQKEFGGRYTQEDLVSLGRYQIICKLLIDGQVSAPFPATTLPLASSTNQNRAKVLQSSRERYARKRTA